MIDDAYVKGASFPVNLIFEESRVTGHGNYAGYFITAHGRDGHEALAEWERIAESLPLAMTADAQRPCLEDLPEGVTLAIAR